MNPFGDCPPDREMPARVLRVLPHDEMTTPASSTSHATESAPIGTRMIAVEWSHVACCPACGCRDQNYLGRLRGERYIYLNESIAFPKGGIPLVGCRACGLVYKTAVLTRQALGRVCKVLEGRVWTSGYAFKDEIDLVHRYVGRDEFDLLDIGAAGGWLLKAASGFPGRRSAMDVAREPGLEDHLRGEFIEGALEDEQLAWSGKPYDVVALFDVVEHFYRADKAFSHLRQFVKPGGILIIETGDVTSSWPARHGVTAWWYADRFPHHIFWSAKTLSDVAHRYGFQVIRSERKRNKNTGALSIRQKAVVHARVGLYRVSPGLYGWLYRQLGNPVAPLPKPRSKDHIQVILKAVEIGFEAGHT